MKKIFDIILSVSEQIKNFSLHLTHKHFIFTMPKRKSKRNKDDQDSSSDFNPNEIEDRKNEELNDIEEEEGAINDIRQELLDKILIFKMVHENQCEDGKTITRNAREESLEEIKSLYDQCDYNISLADYIIRSTLIRWLSFREDMKYWELWDKKEEFISRNSRSRSRDQDRNKSLNRNNRDDRSRSRSRGRNDNYTDISRDRSRERYNEEDKNDERIRKEQVK